MDNTRSVRLTLDTTAGVEQFMLHVEEVMYEALAHEAEARELAMMDPAHGTDIDVVAEEFQTLYDTVKTQIAAAAQRGGMTDVEATKLQVHYNELTELRDALAAAARPQAPAIEEATPDVPQQHAHSTAPVAAPPRQTSGLPRRKTLTLANETNEGNIPIHVRAVQTASPPKQPAAPARRERVPQKSGVQHRSPALANQRNLPSPGIQAPDTERQLRNAPLLALATDARIQQLISTHPRPKQLEQRIVSLINKEEAQQTDRFATWLGDRQAHTFSYLKDKDVSTIFGLAALPITDLRAVLTPHRVRPEAFLHWITVVTDLQNVYPGTPTSTVGEIVISALVLEITSV